MSYLAYLCYRNEYDELLEQTVTLEFERPNDWKYTKVIPIHFSPIHSWTDKDKELYFAKLK